MRFLPSRGAAKRAAIGLCLGVAALASLSCVQPFLIANFDTTYLPRTKRFASRIATPAVTPSGSVV